ncbi:HET-domain-containing protein, partial [Trematosphaeria pertusa]
MTSPLLPYDYTPLPNDDGLRILILEPALNFSDPLRARMIHRRLRDDVIELESPDPPYHAVSYTWGVPSYTEDLICDGRILKITPNVESVLRHLQKNKERYLWIDALCINQRDDAEKARQVARMGGIFGRADKVQVWLGEATEEDEIPTIFEWLKECVAKERFIQKTKEGDRLRKGVILKMEKQRRLVVRLLARPWFHRRWVLQEVALAKDATVRCGPYKTSWSWLTQGISILGPHVYRGAPWSATAVNARRKEYNIVDLLYKFDTSECRDNRDRFFSMYGICKPLESLQPKTLRGARRGIQIQPVDYSEYWADTYINTAQQFILHGYVIAVLQHVLSFGSLHQQNP